MNRFFKKGFAIVLTVIIVFSMMAAHPLRVFAAEVDTEEALIEQVQKGGTAKLKNDITLSATLVIPASKKVTLDLNGKMLKLDAANGGSVIKVEAESKLTLNDTTRTNAGMITGGSAPLGGGILNYGTLIVNGGRIIGNNADRIDSRSGYGGGIFSAGDASLTLSGGVISNNNAYFGGGVYNAFHGSMEIKNGKYTALDKGTSVTVMTGVVITENTATAGAGIRNLGAFSFSGMAELSGNEAGKDLQLDYDEPIVCGKLEYQKPVGVDVMDNHNFTEGFGANNDGNVDKYFFSTYTKARVRLTAAENGEVMLYKDSKTIVEVYHNGTLYKTAEYEKPGDAWTASQNDWTPNWYYFNHPSVRQKAEELKNGKYPLWYSGANHFSDWYDGVKGRADDYDSSDFAGASNDHWEGHLQDDVQVKVILGTDWTLTNYLLIWRFRNVTLDLNGHTLNRGGKKQKGGYVFYLEDFAKLTILDSNPNSENYQGIKGGVITGGNGDDCGGGFVLNDYAELNILGGTIHGCITDEHGGAIYCNDPRAVVNLKNCTFSNNRTQDSGDDCNGGAICIKEAMRVTMENVVFKNNYSEDNGAALYLTNKPGVVRLKNVTFSNNSCKDNGGAIAFGDMNNSKAFLFEAVNCVFEGNSCGADGGAVIVSDNDDSPQKNPIIFRNCTFTKNTSGSDGSAFELDDNSVILIDCSITGNTAKGLGAVYVNDDRKVTLSGRTVIKDNAGQNIILDENGDKTLAVPAGLTEGAYIGINCLGGDNTVLMKGIAKNQLQYFHAYGDHRLEYRKTGTREASLTMASLFGNGSIWIIIGIVSALIITAVIVIVVKKRKERVEK